MKKYLYIILACLMFSMICLSEPSYAVSTSSSNPSGLDSEQANRYNKLTPEGKKYVDEEMRAYDKIFPTTKSDSSGFSGGAFPTTKSDSSGFSGGALLLLLTIFGFAAYQIFSRRDKPLSISEITALQDEFHRIYKPEPQDKLKMLEYKEKAFFEIYDKLTRAMGGKFPLSKKAMIISTQLAREGVEEYRARMKSEIKEREVAISNIQKSIENIIEDHESLKKSAEVVLEASIRVRKSSLKLLDLPQEDISDDPAEAIEMRSMYLRLYEKSEMDIIKYEAVLLSQPDAKSIADLQEQIDSHVIACVALG